MSACMAEVETTLEVVRSSLKLYPWWPERVAKAAVVSYMCESCVWDLRGMADDICKAPPLEAFPSVPTTRYEGKAKEEVLKRPGLNLNKAHMTDEAATNTPNMTPAVAATLG